MKKIFYLIFTLLTFFTNTTKSQDLGPLFTKPNDGGGICYMIFMVEKISNSTDYEYAKWSTNTFLTIGHGHSNLNGIISKYDYLELKKIVNKDKYYKPEEFWQLINPHLGDKSNATSKYWENIKFDNVKKIGSYKIEFH